MRLHTSSYSHLVLCRSRHRSSPWLKAQLVRANPLHPTRPQSLTHRKRRAHHTCAIRTNGTITCWDDNQRNQSTPPPSLTRSSGGHR